MQSGHGFRGSRQCLFPAVETSIIGEHVVRIAGRANARLVARMRSRTCTGVRMFAGVPIWGAVATKRNATRLAPAQMNPARTDLHAFFTFAALRLLDRFNRVEMRTASVGHCRLSFISPRSARNCLDENQSCLSFATYIGNLLLIAAHRPV
jgi:hypothetical protein